MQQLIRLIDFLPKFSRDGFEPIVEWKGGEKNDQGILNLPHPEYDPLVMDFIKEVSTDFWLDNQYVQNMKEIEAVLDNIYLVNDLTLPLIKTLITYFIRGERFCDGHWAAMIDRGYIRAILERLMNILKKED